MIISNKELLEICLKIEREGKVFYRELTKYIEDEKVRDFLLLMASEEAQHEKQFKNMLDEKGESYYGWEDDEDLRRMIDSNFQTDIFPHPDEILEQFPQMQGIQKALDFAVESEQVSREFYGLLLNACKNEEIRDLLAMLLNAEQEHLEKIQSLRKRYLEQNGLD